MPADDAAQRRELARAFALNQKLLVCGNFAWGRRPARADDTIDFLVMGDAIRHIAALDKCLLEFHRVVKPGGTVLLLEVSCPSRTIYRTTLARYLGRGVPYLSYWITREPKVRMLMADHWETMKDPLPPSAITDSMKAASFTRVVCEGWFDLFRSHAGRKSEA